MVFIPGTVVAASFHEVLLWNIKFSYTVNNDMSMNITASIMPIQMGADKSLVSGEIALDIF